MTNDLTRGLAAYMARDWAAALAAKDNYWAARIRRLGAREGVRIADELRRAMLAIDSQWPSEEERRADFEHHVRMAELLRRFESAAAD
jgi:hypothetical protein